MEAKDTVLKQKWMSKEVADNQNALLLEQAEITWDIAFKAGQKDVCTVSASDIYDKGEKAGIQKVVDWQENNPAKHIFRTHEEAQEYDKKWQAKLKGWGINEIRG